MAQLVEHLTGDQREHSGSPGVTDQTVDVQADLSQHNVYHVLVTGSNKSTVKPVLSGPQK